MIYYLNLTTFGIINERRGLFMLFFLIELDEERILKDKKINLEKAYHCIEAAFG